MMCFTRRSLRQDEEEGKGSCAAGDEDRAGEETKK